MSTTATLITWAGKAGTLLTADDLSRYQEIKTAITRLSLGWAYLPRVIGPISVGMELEGGFVIATANLLEPRSLEGGPLDVSLTIWGQNLDAEQLQQDLMAQFPAVADAEISIEALEGTVDGTLGDMIGHALFDIEVEGETAEEIQAQIIAQLLEQGFEGDAVVDVQVEDGQATINIELNDIEVDGDGEVMGETTDTIVIERRTD